MKGSNEDKKHKFEKTTKISTRQNQLFVDYIALFIYTYLLSPRVGLINRDMRYVPTW